MNKLRAKFGSAPLLGTPQIITLPSLCVDGDNEVSNGVQSREYFTVVTVSLSSVQAALNDQQGQFRALGSPVLATCLQQQQGQNQQAGGQPPPDQGQQGGGQAAAGGGGP